MHVGRIRHQTCRASYRSRPGSTRRAALADLDNVPGAYFPPTLTSELSIMRDRDITGTTSRDAALQEIDSLAKKVGLA